MTVHVIQPSIDRRTTLRSNSSKNLYNDEKNMYVWDMMTDEIVILNIVG